MHDWFMIRSGDIVPNTWGIESIVEFSFKQTDFPFGFLDTAELGLHVEQIVRGCTRREILFWLVLSLDDFDLWPNIILKKFWRLLD